MPLKTLPICSKRFQIQISGKAFKVLTQYKYIPAFSYFNKGIVQLARFTIMRIAYRRFIWRPTRPVNMVDCMSRWRYFLKYNINISIIIHFKQCLPSFIQSAVFYRACGPPNIRVVRTAHDCETGLYLWRNKSRATIILNYIILYYRKHRLIDFETSK